MLGGCEDGDVIYSLKFCAEVETMLEFASMVLPRTVFFLLSRTLCCQEPPDKTSFETEQNPIVLGPMSSDGLCLQKILARNEFKEKRQKKREKTGQED